MSLVELWTISEPFVIRSELGVFLRGLSVLMHRQNRSRLASILSPLGRHGPKLPSYLFSAEKRLAGVRRPHLRLVGLTAAC